MAGSQFIITPASCVEDMLVGLQATYPGLSVDIKSKISFYGEESKTSKRKVGLLCGGGSGHEPFVSGFVGEGMLTAAVAGSVFASPPPSHILTAICNVAQVSPGGVLLVFNNYTGDVLNFGLASERAKTKGYNVKSVIVDEDCSIDYPEGAGKRGLCGCLFLIKIAGGLASMARSLEDIYNECITVKKMMATLGVTLKPCNMPGLGPMFQIQEGFMEVGVGIHGEAGATKSKLEPADKIVHLVLEKLCKTLDISSGDRMVVLVNNLGGTSQLELFLIAGQVSIQLRARGVTVVRQYTGTMMTSLDMSGIQVSLLSLPSGNREELWLQCLDLPTTAPAWPSSPLSQPETRGIGITVQTETVSKFTGTMINDEKAVVFRNCLRAASEALIQNEQRLNELDKGCGDGDTGSTLRRLSEVILRDLSSLPAEYPQQFFTQLSQLAEETMGGTSGALYSLMFVGASKSAPSWVPAWQDAMNLVMTYSKARVGDRTMFDALVPACEVFQKEMMNDDRNWHEALSKAVTAAEQGCQQTRHYKPLYGRASYVNASNMRDVDAGAFGVTVWLNAVKKQLLLNN